VVRVVPVAVEARVELRALAQAVLQVARPVVFPAQRQVVLPVVLPAQPDLAEQVAPVVQVERAVAPVVEVQAAPAERSLAACRIASSVCRSRAHRSASTAPCC
jgi:hypothetical protein